MGSLLIVGATFKRHPTFKKKLPLSFVFLLYVEHEFPGPGFISIGCSVLIDWFYNFKFSNLFPSFIFWLVCDVFYFLLPLFNLFILFYFFQRSFIGIVVPI